MKFWVYILISHSSGKFYVGQTSNLRNRLKYHNSNRVRSTKRGGPWSYLYTRWFDSRKEAMVRERKLKNLKSRNKILHWIYNHRDERSFTGPEFYQIYDLT